MNTALRGYSQGLFFTTITNMSFQQHLPTYKNAFETDQRFERVESEHYIFHLFPDSEAQKDIKEIILTQEKAFVKIINFLGVESPDKKIEYFFYPNKEVKIELMGDDWYAQSIYNEFRIHVLYTDDVKPIGPHEDTHLLSLPWGLSFGFMQEGLAEFMVGHAWDGSPHKKYVLEGYKKNLYSPIESFFRHEAWSETDDNYAIYFYSLAGAWSAYLIEMFGKERYKNFYQRSTRDYTKEQNIELFIQIFREDVSKIEADFVSWLKFNS